jgi:hypothetical protein
MNPSFSLRLLDVPAFVIAVFGLLVGVRLAFYGRVGKAQWRRLIDAIVMMTLTGLIFFVVSLFTIEPITPLIAARIGATAGFFGLIVGYIVAGYHSIFFRIMGAAVMFGFGFLSGLGLNLISPLESILLAFSLGAILAVYGWKIGEAIHRYVVIATTAWAGGGWVGGSVGGLVSVLRDESGEYVVTDVILNAMLPLIASVISVWKVLLSPAEVLLYLLSLGIGALVFACGIRYQCLNLQVTSPPITDFGRWLKGIVSKKVVGYLIFGAGVYAFLLVLSRGYNYFGWVKS